MSHLIKCEGKLKTLMTKKLLKYYYITTRKKLYLKISKILRQFRCLKKHIKNIKYKIYFNNKNNVTMEILYLLTRFIILLFGVISYNI